MLTETDGTDATAVYSWNPDYVDSLAVRMTSAEHPQGTSEHFFTHDALYNVTAAVVQGSDDVVERYHYSPYGEVTVLHGDDDADGAVTEWDEDTGGSDIGNEHLYTGRRTDPGTGLQLNRYRYYHQQLGRWVSRDPIGYAAGDVNLYGYVSGSPISSFDPLGLQSLAGHPLSLSNTARSLLAQGGYTAQGLAKALGISTAAAASIIAAYNAELGLETAETKTPTVVPMPTAPAPAPSPEPSPQPVPGVIEILILAEIIEQNFIDPWQDVTPHPSEAANPGIVGSTPVSA